VFEEKLINSGSRSVCAAVVAGRSGNALEEATNPTVASVESMAPFLSGEQSNKLRTIGEIKREIGSIHFPEADADLPLIPELSQTLQYTQAFLWWRRKCRKRSEKNLAEELRSLWKGIGDFASVWPLMIEISRHAGWAVFKQLCFRISARRSKR
jgi:hypothetical protein